MDFLISRSPVKDTNFHLFTLKPVVCIIALLSILFSNVSHSETSNDPHYTDVGFFDIHVCNWPDRPLFFMAIFSTYHFNAISSIQIFMPDNLMIGELTLSKYRLLIDKKKKEKRVFIKQFDIPDNAKDGWYYTKVNLKDGNTIISKDYVIIDKLKIARILSPDINKELDSIPKLITWEKVIGAQYYQVFIHDKWESKLLHTSKLLNKPEIRLPDNLLKKGGFYSIQIHARDTNEHQFLGDFNHGSLSKKIDFSIAE